MRRQSWAYWISTLAFCAVLGFSGIAHAFHLEAMVVSMTALGFPLHFMSVLGVAKLLGVIALLVPGFPRLKEWAYAGFAFNLTGATATHILVADPWSETLPPALLLLIGATSYALRPHSRRWGAAPATEREPGIALVSVAH